MSLVKPFLKEINGWYVDDERILDLKESIESTLSMLYKQASYSDIEHLLIFSQLLGEVIINDKRETIEKEFQKAKAERGW